MKKIFVIFLCCIICLCGCANNKKTGFNYTNEEQIEKDITSYLEQIVEETNTASSNPFDYTKNEYYKNLVSIGKNAVPVLEDMYYKGKLTGLNAYLSALAIQDITQCNLHEKYNLDWSTADEFYTLWKENNCSSKK